ncbi:MAG: hypothetical protein M3220_16320 [Chloroflexota bacterium]|nr:hypothetical protein [Chloroflexota bacterium]
MIGQRYRGLEEVPLEKITGSVGRYRDFDRAFLPRQKQTRSRWLSIDKAHYEDVPLPPVELYKIGDVYFVKDGNHRVSVARERDQAYIDAVVTEIDTPIPITPDTDLEVIVREAERADFFVRTNLHHLRPDQTIRLTEPGQYEKLLEHIHVHRWYLGVENNREIGWEEAVQSWYDRLYVPLVNYIREQEILEDFPNRTETDLYLWIIEHRAHLRGDPDATPVEEAAFDFVETHSERPVKKIVRAVKKTMHALGELAEEIVEGDVIGGDLLPTRRQEDAEDAAESSQPGHPENDKEQ